MVGELTFHLKLNEIVKKIPLLTQFFTQALKWVIIKVDEKHAIIKIEGDALISQIYQILQTILQEADCPIMNSKKEFHQLLLYIIRNSDPELTDLQLTLIIFSHTCDYCGISMDPNDHLVQYYENLLKISYTVQYICHFMTSVYTYHNFHFPSEIDQCIYSQVAYNKMEQKMLIKK